MRSIQQTELGTMIYAGWGNIHVYLVGKENDDYIDYHVRFQTPVFDWDILNLPNVVKVEKSAVSTSLGEYKDDEHNGHVWSSREDKATGFAIKRGEKVLHYIWKLLEVIRKYI